MELHDFCSMGGKARAAKLSKAKLTEIAKKAASVRWSKAVQVTSVPVLPMSPPEPERRRCQVSHCTNVGYERNIQGLKAWLCNTHT